MNTRKNINGKLTTPSQVISALNLNTAGAGLIDACDFITYMMSENGADLSPAQLAGQIKATALHFVQLAKAYPEKAASLPKLKEAAALVALLPRA
jgi:hypothetical protein